MANYDFPPGSRYYDIAVAQLPQPDGGALPYLRRRFLPAADALATLARRRVVEGDRPDLIAARELGDAEAFWRLCDANATMHPDELTAEPGAIVRIALPDGVPPPARE
ncbi:LysM domain-containing protein [Lysobacter enzymogenes]|uniref:LysM domain-containing protein n=1 Tax=Lysobacter enzymogenes TaxID=69 RepID=UPI001A96E455|nr:LysM domain-containing protein [Lysobacter enzymogenes]QQP98138.1 LysM domain-containing protein [Lysobacter enzymogenes]